MKRLLLIVLIISTLFISVSCATSPNFPQVSTNTEDIIGEYRSQRRQTRYCCYCS